MEDTLVQQVGSTTSTIGAYSNSPHKVEYLAWIPSWFPRKVHNLLAWNNVYLSTAIFLAGNCLFLLFILGKVSLLSLIAYVAMLELALSFVFVQCSNLLVGFLGSDFYSPPSLGKSYVTEEYLSKQLDQLIPLINKAIDEWKKIIFCTDNRRTLRLCLVAYIFAKLGHVVSFLSLLYLCFLYLFTVPILYHTFQQPVDHSVSRMMAFAYECWSPIQYHLQQRLQKLVDHCPQRIRSILTQHLQPLVEKTKTQ
ncbi:hypothetical protein GpartN1_g1595.t1 [Galdieria partita]|uniref:Reticulon-like protein n=1 Tax=Galdieria partita TaxID=83374 RepID=A0A9C7UND3_9RHOD|nr:hypothetical protein GpartN1_g1595.t1 [Galdieria partita]